MTNDLTIHSTKERRVVCASLYDKELDLNICGARHCDTVMWYQICAMEGMKERVPSMEQGFIDQWGKFMSREEAFEVATAAEQIIKKTGNPDSKELFSEDIY